MPIVIPSGVLFVEGKDDEHAIKQLLARHEVHIHDDDCPLRLRPAGSDTAVIDSIPVAIKASGNDPVGFVLDTDAFGDQERLSLADRWRAVRNRLKTAGVEFPTPELAVEAELPAGGFISESRNFSRNVGVWLMPDNRTDYGKIEDMLATLVPRGDDIFELASASTSEALQRSAKRDPSRRAIQAKDQRKGELHSWLAWQKDPGMSYGHALRRKYFEHESTVASAFVRWFKALYRIS